MKGSTFKRCTDCDRVVKGRRCTNCKAASVSWGYVVDLAKDGDGKRRQRRRTGFPTERDADRPCRSCSPRSATGPRSRRRR